MEEYSEQYKARCIKRLKEWGAPLDGWYCVQMNDVAGDDDSAADDEVLAACELCNYPSVRYVHVMRNNDYFEDVKVGCICAGILEGDILSAKERERRMKNRLKRKSNFPSRKWKENRFGGYSLKYKGNWININRSQFNQNQFGVSCNGKSTWKYKNDPITSFLAAAYAAFDLVDPAERISV